MIQPDMLKAILDTIEGTDYKNVESPSLLMEYGFKLQQWMAYSGSQMAEAKKALHEARRAAMINLIASLKANGATLGAALQKDYVNDLCAEENSVYELAGRVNSSCIHALDFVRSCLSTLKAEMNLTQNTSV